ncbi:MAG: GIY-YIG nuclease family protein [Candidatus Levyibacteriota bacterium]
MYYIYFAKSERNNKVYVGFTGKDPKDRVEEHNASANQWSRANKPLQLKYYESYSCKEDVMMREKFYKTGIGKRVKKAIIQEFDKDS